MSLNDSFAVLVGFFKVRILKPYYIISYFQCVLNTSIKSIIFAYFVKPVGIKGA